MVRSWFWWASFMFLRWAAAAGRILVLLGHSWPGNGAYRSFSEVIRVGRPRQHAVDSPPCHPSLSPLSAFMDRSLIPIYPSCFHGWADGKHSLMARLRDPIKIDYCILSVLNWSCKTFASVIPLMSWLDWPSLRLCMSQLGHLACLDVWLAFPVFFNRIRGT